MKIQLAELQRIITRSQNINDNLNAELSRMAKVLDDICNNVNSSELTASNRNLVNAINDTSEKVRTNLPRVIEFLNSQVASYQSTNANTKQQIDSLISAVDSALGN